MIKKLKVELVIFEPVRFLPYSLLPCWTVCLRLVQSVGILQLLSDHVLKQFVRIQRRSR